MDISLCSNTSDSILNETCMEDYASCPDPSLCIVQSGGNVGLAFGLTIGAGLATTIGALLPFVPFIKRANTHFLAAGLGLAAGVMLYVSFTEIWTKSRDNFCCITIKHFDLAVTACFFGGVLITVLLDLLVAGLQKLDCGCRCCHCCVSKDRMITDNDDRFKRGKYLRYLFRMRTNRGSIRATNALQMEGNGFQKASSVGPILDSASPSSLGNNVNGHIPQSNGVNNHDNNSTSSPVSRGPSLSTSNVHPPLYYEQQSQIPSECDSQQFMGTGIDGGSVSINSNAPSDSTNHYNAASINELFSNTSLLRMNAIIPETASLSLAEVEEKEGGEERSGSHVGVVVEEEGVGENRSENQGDDGNSSEEEALGPVEFKAVTEGLDKSTKKLHRMGILTAVAIGLHNFPEGMATFVAALSSPSLGIALAIAIALHNVPEGLCVSMPVYYATGSRWKGFLWAFLSGISEPIGALLGWLILKDLFGPLVFAISFGLISGMMVFISLKELLPTAYRFDKTRGRLVTLFLALGMFIMALSLILFLY